MHVKLYRQSPFQYCSHMSQCCHRTGDRMKKRPQGGDNGQIRPIGQAGECTKIHILSFTLESPHPMFTQSTIIVLCPCAHTSWEVLFSRKSLNAFFISLLRITFICHHYCCIYTPVNSTFKARAPSDTHCTCKGENSYMYTGSRK